MNQDPVYQKLREISWRRPLTEAEQAELQAWLVAHPQHQADIDAELALSATLTTLPDAPVPSNFTARVMQAITTDQPQAARPKAAAASPWWRGLLPRLAVVSALLVGGLLVWQQQVAHQKDLAHVAREVASAKLLANPNVLTHFDEIASLTPLAATPDEGLLAMSEELLALGQ